MVGNISKLTIITAVYGRPIELEKNIQSYNSAAEKITERPTRIFVFSDHKDLNFKQFEYLLETKLDKSTHKKILRVMPSGIYNALNIGINNTSTEFLMFNHSDDYFTPNAFIHIGKINLNEADIFSFSIITSSKLIQTNLGQEFPFVAIGINHSATIFKTTMHKNFLYNEKMKFSADWHQIIIMFENGIKFLSCKPVVCYFSDNGASNSRSFHRLSEDINLLLSSIFNGHKVHLCIKRIIFELLGHIKKYTS